MLVEFGSDLEEFSTIPKHILFALLAQPHLSSLTLYFLPCTSISANLQSLQFHEHASFGFLCFTLTLFLHLKCPCPTYQILLSLERENRILIRKGNVFLFPSFASKATFCILPSWPEICCSLSWLLVFTLVSTKL